MHTIALPLGRFPGWRTPNSSPPDADEPQWNHFCEAFGKRNATGGRMPFGPLESRESGSHYTRTLTESTVPESIRPKGELRAALATRLFRRDATRLFLAFLLVAVVPSFILIRGSLDRGRRAFEQEAFWNLRLVVNDIEANVIDRVEDIRDDARVISSNPAVIALLASASHMGRDVADSLGPILTDYRDECPIKCHESFAVTIDRRVVASSVGRVDSAYAWQPPPGLIPKRSDAFGGEHVITEAFVSDVLAEDGATGARWIAVAPVHLPDSDSLVGLIVNELDVSVLDRIVGGHGPFATDALGEHRHTSTGEAFLINRNGALLTRPRWGQTGAAWDTVQTRQVREAAARATSWIGEYQKPGGDKATFAIAEPVPYHQWMIVVEMAREEAMAPYQVLRNELMALAVAVALGMTIVIAVLGTHSVRPIRALIEAEERLADGQKDTALIPPEQMPDDEMGDLMRKRNVAVQRVISAEAELKRIFDLTMDIVCVAGFDGTFKRVNPAFEKVLGYSSEDLTTLSIFNTIHPDDHGPAKHTMQRLTKGREVNNLILRSICRDGSSKWVSWDARPQVSEGLFYAVGRDVTELREMELQRLKFEFLVDQSPDFVGSATPDGLVTYINPAGEALLGIPESHPIYETPIDECLAAEDREKLHNQVFPAVLRDGMWRGELRFRHFQTNGTILLEAHAFFIRNQEDGTPIGHAVIAHDISERKTHERELRETTEQLEQLAEEQRLWLEQSTDFVYRQDRRGAVTYASPSVERITGYTAEDIHHGLRPYLTDHPLNAVALTQFEETLATGQEFPSFCVELRHKQGHTIVLEVRERTYSIDGEIAGLHGVARDVTARVRAEESLELTQFAVDHAGDMVFWANRQGRFAYANERACELLGYTAEELRQLGPPDIDETMRPEDWPHEWAQLKQAGTTTFEAVVLNRHQRRIPVEMTVYHMEFHEQEFLCGILRDITDRQRSEQALRQSEEHYRALIEHTYDLIAVIDTHGFIQYTSPSVTRILGYQQEEAFSLSIFKLVAPKDRPQAAQLHRRLLREPGTVFTFELDMLHKNGSYRTMQGTLKRPADESRVVDIIINAQDVTERKRATESKMLLAAAVDQVAEFIMITDTKGIIQYVNPAFERMTGYTPEEAVGSTPNILNSGRHEPSFFAELWETLGRGDVWRGRLTDRRKDYGIIYLDATIAPVRDTSGKVVNFVGVNRDVTEAVMMETHLRHSQKLEALGSLAAGIAHEINTPVQFIGDNTRFLSDSFGQLVAAIDGLSEIVETLADHPDYADRVRLLEQKHQAAELDYLRGEFPRAIEQTLEGVERVSHIVRAMKHFSHPGIGNHTLVDINQALANTLAVARGDIKEVADVITDLSTDLPMIHCQASDLNQVFLNLLINAAQAIGMEDRGRGTIRVGTRQVADQIEITITDSGPGIPDHLKDRIFDPFFTTKGVGQGTGQGLAISQAVVRNHGGTLTFETEVGAGTTFAIRLPIELTAVVEEV